MDLATFQKKMKQIKNKGFIKTIRRGDTGVGHTLEQELGLIENNIALSDLLDAELKAARRNATSMLTLFTKEPLSDYGRSRDRFLLETFAYPSSKKDRISELYTTISADSFNSQGFKLEVNHEKIKLIHNKVPINIYWTSEMLKEVFEAKLPALVYVIADSRGSGADEEFHYTEAFLLEQFDFSGFISAIKESHIKVDLRMHLKKNGVPRNHGTAFRIIKSAIPLCFKKQTPLI